MIYLALGAGLLALLVWAGRGKARARVGLRAASALVAALAAAGAVVEGLRGGWMVSVGLIALSIWLGQSALPTHGSGRSDGGAADGMTADQARAILGVAQNATRAEIEAAYRHLIRRTHPDQGGTSGLAAQLNAARDRLLK
jgi:DnaJ domain